MVEKKFRGKTMNESVYGYCDNCRIKFDNQEDMNLIIFDRPKKGITRYLSQSHKFRLCQPCFLIIGDLVEYRVIGGKKI